jgi:hypothetical protein
METVWHGTTHSEMLMEDDVRLRQNLADLAK